MLYKTDFYMYCDVHHPQICSCVQGLDWYPGYFTIDSIQIEWMKVIALPLLENLLGFFNNACIYYMHLFMSTRLDCGIPFEIVQKLTLSIVKLTLLPEGLFLLEGLSLLAFRILVLLNAICQVIFRLLIELYFSHFCVKRCGLLFYVTCLQHYALYN